MQESMLESYVNRVISPLPFPATEHIRNSHEPRAGAKSCLQRDLTYTISICIVVSQQCFTSMPVFSQRQRASPRFSEADSALPTPAVCLPGATAPECLGAGTCPQGQYSSGPSCLDCPARHTTFAPGATSKADCKGAHQPGGSCDITVHAVSIWIVLGSKQASVPSRKIAGMCHLFTSLFILDYSYHLPIHAPSPTACAPGFGGILCSQCAIGKWSAGGNAAAPKAACQPCPTGRTSPRVRTTSTAGCSGA